MQKNYFIRSTLRGVFCMFFPSPLENRKNFGLCLERREKKTIIFLKWRVSHHYLHYLPWHLWRYIFSPICSDCGIKIIEKCLNQYYTSLSLIPCPILPTEWMCSAAAPMEQFLKAILSLFIYMLFLEYSSLELTDSF